MILIGDTIAQMRTLPDASVHCCITSPPYWGLRDYGTATWEGGDAECDHSAVVAPRSTRPSGGLEGGKATVDASTIQRNCRKCGAVRVDKQIGLEATPELFIARMVEVFREVRRVLHPSGTCWVNLGDSYTSGGRESFGTFTADSKQASHPNIKSTPRAAQPEGLKPKDLVGIPWLVAFALRADGWWLRQDIIWAKPNPMPESVTDRCTKSHEYLFLLSKRERYFFDAEAIKEPSESEGKPLAFTSVQADAIGRAPSGNQLPENYNKLRGPTRNRRSVWTITPQPFKEAHFATYPEDLVEPCIKAGTSERGCCPKCLAPWERVTEKPKPPADVYTSTRAPKDGLVSVVNSNGNPVGSGSKYQDWANENPAKTLGWQPTCKCEAGEPIPCTVLDPFLGSGTTLLVARKLGRNGIGCELNPQYAAMAERRINNYAPLFGATA